MRTLSVILIIGMCLGLAGCSATSNNENDQDSEPMVRPDGAGLLAFAAEGSLQNPAWSPDGNEVLLTGFREGYNTEPADLLIFNLESGELRTLVSDGSGNVNLPGAAWNAQQGQIVFSSSREPHDEIYTISPDGETGDELRITARGEFMAFEPSLSPDGQWVVFESHALDQKDHGVITRYRVDGSEPFRELTAPQDDCRQPNWSPAGDLIVYQKLESGQWDLWVTDPEGEDHQKITSGVGDKTDASFSPAGDFLVYSSNESGEEYANLHIISVDGGASTRLTDFDGYDGAPSWSPDGSRVIFESYPGDPDGSAGTNLWIIDTPP